MCQGIGTAPLELRLPEDRLVADLASVLSARPIEYLEEGGSPAKVLLMRSSSGRHLVLKYLLHIPGVVDGHDLGTFRLKMRQIKKVRLEAPGLRSSYTELLHEFDGDNWAAYVMPFHNGKDVADCLRGPCPDLPLFFRRLGTTLSIVAKHGYRLNPVEAPANHVHDVHLKRFQRRTWLLERHLPAQLVHGERILINGIPCEPPSKILPRLAPSSSALRRLAPRWLWFPVHGDLNTRNILVPPRCAGEPVNSGNTFMLIDPRGTLAHWDPCYDLAKVLFSLTVWDSALRQGFDIRTGSRPRRQLAYEVTFRSGPFKAYVEAARQFVSFLVGLEGLRPVLQADPGWRERLLLAHSFHLLAEAACRLSDVRPRAASSAGQEITPLELALGHYLLGTLFLNDIVRRLERNRPVNVDRHLDLLVAY